MRRAKTNPDPRRACKEAGAARRGAPSGVLAEFAAPEWARALRRSGATTVGASKLRGARLATAG